MLRVAVLVALLSALLWQSVALGRVGSAVNVFADQEHAALHWHEVAHHHHDDGSHHRDDSQASAQHVLIDHVSTTAVFFVTALHSGPSLRSAAPDGLHETTVPDPTLAGLLRPPRPRS